MRKFRVWFTDNTYTVVSGKSKDQALLKIAEHERADITAVVEFA